MREWALPERSWVMAQTWRDLLFAHWRVPPADLGRVVPLPLELDLWEGSAWIGVVPFRMDRIRPRGMFAVPGISATPEINVRTYVKFGGKRGVYFLSLHASNRAAVKVARRFFHLPYHPAKMNVRSQEDMVHYESAGELAQFRGSYRPTGEVAPGQPGTLEYWLTERYCFYALDPQGRVIRGEVDHPRWPLQPAEASIETNTMTEPFGIDLPDEPPLLHFSRTLDVILWMPEQA
ncbi:MAG TPA: DUF2071 domain-containing protein [Bryobacteraceae bacterium]|nr:DUF2071 domain-containing protein [Bryobacteraceae bacterium]